MALREITLEQAMARVGGKSVAVVGNSSDLLSQEWGYKIDKRDVVIRMNRAMPGYHGASIKATGAKTTILGCGVISPFDEVFKAGVPEDLWWFTHPLAGAIHLAEVARSPVFKDCRVLWWPGKLEGRLHDLLGGTAPSSGLRIAYMLKHHAQPKSIDFYGFGFWGYASNSKINWHSGGGAHSAHDPRKEFNYFIGMGFHHKGGGHWTSTS